MSGRRLSVFRTPQIEIWHSLQFLQYPRSKMVSYQGHLLEYSWQEGRELHHLHILGSDPYLDWVGAVPVLDVLHTVAGAPHPGWENMLSPSLLDSTQTSSFPVPGAPPPYTLSPKSSLFFSPHYTVVQAHRTEQESSCCQDSGWPTLSSHGLHHHQSQILRSKETVYNVVSKDMCYGNLNKNKPSFCSGSCDECHATWKFLKHLESFLETSLKHSGNVLEYHKTPLKHPWNFLFH